MTNLEFKENLLLAYEIGRKVISNSKDYDNTQKETILSSMLVYKVIVEGLIPGDGLNLHSLKSMSTAMLTQWNEGIGLHTEQFWAEMKLRKSLIERKDPLKLALSKKRFRNVHEGMQARKSWKDLRNFETINERFSNTELNEIDQIIQKDENTRVELLKKCLTKKRIPQSQYLKFGECAAYIHNCKLSQKYFSNEEISQLNKIWKNFKFVERSK